MDIAQCNSDLEKIQRLHCRIESFFVISNITSTLDKPFKLYRSSAGSGKTYTLAKEYLKLALTRPKYYRHILAVTFTNKATREMKDRIIAYLYGFSQGQSSPLADELCAALQWDFQKLKTQSQKVLSTMLHGYGHFSISTIDAFFQKVIRSFSKEVGLHGSFKLELDQDKVLTEVIDELMLEIGDNVLLTDWLVQFAQEKVDEGKSWDIRRDIKNLSFELFSEDFKSFEGQLLQLSSTKGFFESFLEQVQNIIKDIEVHLQKIGQHGQQLIESHALSLDDFSRKAQGPAGYLYKFAQGTFTDNKGFLTSANSYVAKGLLGAEGWYTKTSKKQTLIEQVVQGGLMDVLVEAITVADTYRMSYETARQVRRYIYTFGILMDITRKLKDYKEENNLMLISDAAHFLQEIIADNESPFVYEKVGAFYHHYLIDEFQDTSGFQWGNFKPLIADSLAQGQTNLIVGDIKQSIYRWRGGDWRLLLEGVMNQVGASQTEVLNLDTNYRSARQVIEFNNHCFYQMTEQLTQQLTARWEPMEDKELKASLTTSTLKIKEAYADVAQACPEGNDSKPSGQVKVDFFEEKRIEEITGEEIHWKDEVLKTVPALLEQYQDAGVAMGDIAVLVRTAKEGKIVADFLMDHKRSDKARAGYSYEVISSEALFLESSPTVRLLLHLFTHLVHPYDSVVKANIVYDYQHYIINKADSDPHQLFSSINSSEFETWLPKSFVERKVYLHRIPLYELTEELIQCFQLNRFSSDFAYLQAFQDLVLNFEKDQHGGISAFLDWWDKQGHKQSIQVSETDHAAQIMTIHKSKGLQFEVVLIPFCDWNLDHDTLKDNILWCSSSKEPFRSAGHLPLRYGKALAETFFRRDYYEEMIRATMDNLNVLYVAFTRAKRLLQVFAPSESKKKGKISELLLDMVCREGFLVGSEWQEEQQCFQYGPGISPLKKEKPSISPTSKDSLELKTYPSHNWRGKLAIQRQSKGFFEKDQVNIKVKVSEGVLLHRLMSKIRYKEDLYSALDTLYYEGLFDEDEKSMLEERILHLWKNPLIESWFQPTWQVKTEVPILPKTGEMNRLDRVLFDKKNVVIIDYKTGDMRQKDHWQVKEYIELLRQMGYERVQGYLLYIKGPTVVPVVYR